MSIVGVLGSIQSSVPKEKITEILSVGKPEIKEMFEMFICFNVSFHTILEFAI